MRRIRWIALVLALAIVLTACSGMSFEELMSQLGTQAITPFSEMVYTRPDMDKMESALTDCCTSAETETNKEKPCAVSTEFFRFLNAVAM